MAATACKQALKKVAERVTSQTFPINLDLQAEYITACCMAIAGEFKLAQANQ